MAKNKNSTENRYSRYTQGGTTDRYPTRLGWWDRTQFSISDTDVTFIITAKHQFRPDLVAYEVYQNRELMWLVLQYNNILDVMTEFVEGKELRLPILSRVLTEIVVGSTGGNVVK